MALIQFGDSALFEDKLTGQLGICVGLKIKSRSNDTVSTAKLAKLQNDIKN